MVSTRLAPHGYPQRNDCASTVRPCGRPGADPVSGPAPPPAPRCSREPSYPRRARGHDRGRRDILGLWAGGGVGAEHWVHILTEIKNRGVNDVLMLVRDGLMGLPDAVETVWSRPTVQTCVVHLLRNPSRCAARQDQDKIARVLKPVRTAARLRLREGRTHSSRGRGTMTASIPAGPRVPLSVAAFRMGYRHRTKVRRSSRQLCQVPPESPWTTLPACTAG